MALVILGETTCAISGKIISGKENFLCFPQFLCDPNDPAIVCQDACVLREEFDKWELGDHVTRRVKEFWSLDYRLREARGTSTVVFESNDYLVVKSKVEEKVRILFLQHVFVIDVPKVTWQKFCKVLRSESNLIRFSPYSLKTKLIFSKRAEGVKICLHTQHIGKDCIQLSPSEWSRFQSILAAKESLFD
ncbi:MAG: hypothetical protein GY833_16300 [Aestuariibacter sp.]|nr:hypothetical protein [Aestuariibacter sp.]